MHLCRTKPPRIRGAAVIAPAQVLPQANTLTVRRRLLDWSVLSTSGPGAKLDVEGKLTEALESAAWPIIVHVTDNLSLNHCNFRLECRAFDSGTSLLNIECCGHSIVLGLKPTYRRLNNLPGTLVRLGHIMENGRCEESLGKAIVAEVKECFHYRLVDAMPPDWEQWRAEATRVMKASRPALDIDDKEETLILSGDNGDWSQDDVYHWCVRGQCALGCDENREKSLKIVTQCVLTSIGKGYITPLEYRWKGMEKASSKAFRGRRQHRLLDRALERMCPKNIVDKARANIVQVGEQEADFTVKRQIRAGKVIDAFNKAPHVLDFESAQVANVPGQTYLKAVFKQSLLPPTLYPKPFAPAQPVLLRAPGRTPNAKPWP